MNANEITNFPKNRKPLKVSIKNALIPKYFFIKCFSSLQPLKHFLRLISNVLFIRNLTQTFQISLIQKKKKKKKPLKKSFEFENHLLIRTDMLQTYFEPAVYIAVSKAEPGLGI